MRARATRVSAFVICFFCSHLSFLPAFAQHMHGPARQAQTKVVIRMEKQLFKRGEGINVHVDLEAGAKGMYVAQGWGKAGDNVPGFSISLTTEDGRPAQTCGGESVAENAGPLPPPADVFKKNFIFVAAGQSVGYKETLACVTPLPGKYKVLASYHPDYPQTPEVAKLPEAHGLVLDHAVDAGPISIEIR
jgi:hypothetical protein